MLTTNVHIYCGVNKSFTYFYAGLMNISVDEITYVLTDSTNKGRKIHGVKRGIDWLSQ